jgi:hypothetical protein
MAHKQEYPPLLTQGFHHLSIQQIKALCVEGFPLSRTRADMMAAFELVYEQTQALQLHGEFWLDGSFLTHKIEPTDIDFVLFVAALFYDSGTPQQKAFLDWLINKEDDPRKSFHCDTDVVLVYEESHIEHGHYLQIARHWKDEVYGYSVTTREPKGIVVVSLTGGIVA